MSTHVHHRFLGLRSGCKWIGGKANTFISDNEQRTRFVLETNVFGAGDEHF